MILNLIHRPAAGRKYEMFRLQQKMAHELKLKVTILVPYDMMFQTQCVQDILDDHNRYGDEIGIYMAELTGGRIQQYVTSPDPFLWLHDRAGKETILTQVVTKFRQVFGMEPLAFGSYHLDAVSAELLRAICPSIKISIAGCFEEGVKVYHGCNHSWYLFNEGMPWGPWYPAKENSLRPASNAEEWNGLVAVPHLTRDLVLSYEGRNDFFASHPANVQRAMANDGATAPYTQNLLDTYRFQERLNGGFSYTNVFVGPNWLRDSANVQDSDEITQGLYYAYLTYFAQLRAEGSVQDLHMSEFAAWYQAHIPIGTASCFDAREILYGSGKRYFWYCDSQMRVTLDCFQGGSIGDLRPFVAKQPRCTGVDMPQGMMGSNPYLIHSQYRTGNAHHFADGARTTLYICHGNQTVDLADIPVKISRIHRTQTVTEVAFAPVTVRFDAGVQAELESKVEFLADGSMRFVRKLRSGTTPDAQFRLTEYCKGCWGVTEYPEEMHDLTLTLEDVESGEICDSLTYRYGGRTLRRQGATAARVDVPPLETTLSLIPEDGNFLEAEAVEGYLFNPFYTLKQTALLRAGEEVHTKLCLRKSK